MGCYIWYSEEGTGRGPNPSSSLLAVSNLTTHSLTACVPIALLLYNGPWLCDFSVPIKGLMNVFWQVYRHSFHPSVSRSMFFWNRSYSVVIYLRQMRRYMFSPAPPRSFACLSVCLCVCKINQKTRARPPSPLLTVPNITAHPSTASVPITVLLHDGPLLWIKCCVSTDVGTWTNW